MFLKEFGKRLESVRKDRGISKHNLAMETGLEVSQITTFEAGQEMPTLLAATLLARELNVSIDSLVGIV